MMKINKEVVSEFRSVIMSNPESRVGIEGAEHLFSEFASGEFIAMNLLTCADVKDTLRILNVLPNETDTVFQAVMVTMMYKEEIVPVILMSVEDTGLRGDIPLEIFLKSYMVHELTHLKQLKRFGLKEYTERCSDVYEGTDYKENELESEAFSEQFKYVERFGYVMKFL